MKKLFLILSFTLLFTSCTLFKKSNPDTNLSDSENKPVATEPPCGIENCHGLDIQCGPNLSDFCTTEYKVGDICRKYTQCKIIDGSCQQAISEKFVSCKDCVEKCISKYSEPIEQMDCESQCQ